MLLDAARELFGAHGYDATSTHAIAKHAGVSQSLVYRHFPNKSELFVEAVFDPFVELLDSFLERWDLDDTEGSIDDITRGFTAALYSGVREERDLLLAIMAARILRTDSGDDKGHAAQAILGRVFGRIEAEHTRAALAHDLRTDPPLTARFTFGLALTTAVFNDRLFATLDPRPTADEILIALSTFVSQGATGKPAATPTDLARSSWTHRRTAPLDNQPSPSHGQRPAGSVRPLLLSTARVLFASRGYAATSTKEIATHAQVAESLLFHHFATKPDLYNAAITQPLTAALETLAVQVRQSTSLSRTVIDLFDHLTAHRDLLDAASTAPPGSDQNSSELEEQLANLYAGIELQLPEQGDALTTRLVFALVFAVALLDDWLLAGTDPRPPRERLLTELVSFVISGTTRR